MSTVKIKAKPTTTATTTVDVQVKLEPSLSTAGIKLEHRASDDSDDSEDADQNQRQFVCDHPGCSLIFSYAGNLSMHQHEHRLHTKVSIFGRTYILTRQSLDDRWACPIPDCNRTFKTVQTVSIHIRRYHTETMRQQQLHQHSPGQKTQRIICFPGVDNFYVGDIRCGYHSGTGVFICHSCRLVPECLLTHLQHKHGYDDKSIDNSTLPESAVNASVGPNINQHTSNSYLAAAIRQPYRHHHQDIVRGWLCVTSDCDYCGYASSDFYHRKAMHQGDQIAIAPALILRLVYTKSKASHFLISRIDQVTASNNMVTQHKIDHSHNGLDAQDENGDDTERESNQTDQWKCTYPGCKRSFNSTRQFNVHRREHKCDVMIKVRGNSFTLSRPSSYNRWPCPIPGCDVTCKTIRTTQNHIMYIHSIPVKQKHTNAENDNDQQLQQQSIIKKKQRRKIYCLNVDHFYVNDIRCGYHNPTGLFICHECRLVPECLLTHLQQSHGYDEKSIDAEILPDSAKITGSDRSGNQHTNNPHLAAAIRESSQLHHPDIVQGLLCIAPDCGYCYSTKSSGFNHQYSEHRGEKISTVPALVLRLNYAKTQTLCFLITRLDTITSTDDISNNSMVQQISECDDDGGSESVPSGIDDENDNH